MASLFFKLMNLMKSVICFKSVGLIQSLVLNLRCTSIYDIILYSVFVVICLLACVVSLQI